jgi:hypothetical protein
MAFSVQTDEPGAIRVRSPSVEIDEAAMIEELVEAFPLECEENRSLVVFAAAIMLKYRKHNIARAKERLGNYLNWRRSMFGDLCCHLVETDEALGELLSTCVMQTIPPLGGTQGAVTLYIQMKVHDSSKYTALQVVKCMHYLIMGAIRRDINVAHHGFAVICNLSDAELKNFDLDIGRYVAMAVRDVLPLRVVSAVIYNAPMMLHYLVGIVTLFFPTKLQERICSLATGEEEELLGDLKFPASVIPQCLGGTYKLLTPENHRKFYQDLNLSV